ncbi:glutamine synthetase family protein [Leifsonia kafniensis]|uniref:Glutamine synthetase family protein n=1 Tax=Leifsonia kafniensis TaxID=475957 RepID=A0ABP7KUP2_9MICO
MIVEQRRTDESDPIVTLPTNRSTRDELEAAMLALESAGVALLVGTALDYAGVTRSKGVPVRRLAAFHETGMGASPTWVVFCSDNGIAFTPSIGVVGDLRLRIDSSQVRQIDEGLAWGPTDYYNQDGTLSESCARGRLAAVVESAAALGLAPLMGTELEFTLTTRDGQELPKTAWSAYGMSAVIRNREFLVDLTASLEKAGVWPEQIHAEYGVDQFEVSLAPASPVAMADASILARIVIGIVAERHDMAVSFSPLPWITRSGNGAHLHLSLSRDGAGLFGGGDGPHGMTAEGGSAIAGILAALPELLGVYAGSAISAQRLKPGSWSGASACWGLENREAALRFLAGTLGNPHGANIELKIVDPSANIYIAAAALLGSALHGVTHSLPLPAEVSTDPASVGASSVGSAGVDSASGSDPAVLALPADQKSILDALEQSALAVEILGAGIVEGVVAVRRHEQQVFADASPEEIAAALRFAWS